MLQTLLTGASKILIHGLKPFKLHAYQTSMPFVKRLILELTSPLDFAMIWMNTQNETMLLHWRAYGGNFIFGKGVMVTDHPTADAEMPRPSIRGNHFMGVHIVASSSEVFATNSPMINMGQPLRRLAREHFDQNIVTPEVRDLSYEKVVERCAEILNDWSQDPEMKKEAVLRSAATRIIVQLLSGTTITKADSESVTAAYMQGFGELSLVGRYLPSIAGLLGSKRNLRSKAYFKLREYGMDDLAIDATLFAAMFSLGTLVIRCIGDIHREGIDFKALDQAAKMRFVIEAVRLFPTVTSTHRIVEHPETLTVAGSPLHLQPGDEVVYALACINRDRTVFADPESMNINRDTDEADRVLSWSKGPHVCPAKDLSIVVTTIMLDQLAERYDLKNLRYGRSPI